MFESVKTKPITVVNSDDFPQSNLPEFVFIGRSNVGKSSLLNALTRRKNLAYTSQSPGKTQTINFYLIDERFYLVDVPGYGYAKVSKQAREAFGVMIEGYLTTRQSLRCVYLLIDMRHAPLEDDLIMVNYLKQMKLPFKILLTKADKLSNNQQASQRARLAKGFTLAADDFIVTAATTNLNIDLLRLDIIGQL